MRVLLRADASEATGSGHVMRCLALAEGLVARGHRATIVSAALPAGIRAAVEGRGIPALPISEGSGREALASVVADQGADWVVFDGYEFDEDDLRAAHERTRVMAIADDAAMATYPCDIVLNQNVYANVEEYAGRTAARALIGPRFALLRSEFARLAEVARSTPDRATSVLVTLGGSDPGGLTAPVVRAVRAALADASITVVVGGANSQGPAVLSELTDAGQVRVVHAAPDMAELMAAADLAISSAGSTTAELAVMGLPSVLLVIAANQRPVAAGMEAAGAALVADDVTTGHGLDAGGLERLVAALADDAAARARMTAAGRALVDGRGVHRVVQAMEATGLAIRRATMDDAELLHRWTNDAATRTASFRSDPIAWDDHVAWLDARLKDADSLLLVGVHGVPVGQVRFQRTSDEAVISVSVAPDMRGRGLAAALVDAGVRAAFERWPVARIRAEIRSDNHASMAAFTDAAFGPPSPHPTREDAVVMWRRRLGASEDQEETR